MQISFPNFPIFVYGAHTPSAASLARILKADGLRVRSFTNAARFPRTWTKGGLILIPDHSPDVDYVASVIRELNAARIPIPTFAYSAENPRPEKIINAIKAGVVDYVVGKIDSGTLRQRISATREEFESYFALRSISFEAQELLASLTPRELDVLELLSEGQTSREIADDLKISHRTVEVHRASFMKKPGSRHVVDAVRVLANAKLFDGQVNSANDDNTINRIHIKPQAVWRILDVL